MAAYEPGNGPTFYQLLDLGLLSLQICDKQMCAVQKPPSLWYFFIVAQTDEDGLVGN